MAKKRLTDLQLLADIANSDVVHLVDVSDTTQNIAGSSRKVTMSTIKSYVTSGLTISWDNVSGKPSTFAPSAHTHPIADIQATGTPSASTYLRGDGSWAVVSGGGGTWETITGDQSSVNVGGFNNDVGYITSYTENDPVFSAWLDTDPLDGFLTSESDPIYSASSWFSTTNNSGNWDTAFGWGNHASAGYLTSESDPVFTASDVFGVTTTDISNWNTAFGWGDHSSGGYAKLDGSNQPFTGDIDISKISPRLSLIETTAGENAEAYIQKLATGNETRRVSQNRPFVADGGVTTTIANNGGTFSHTLSNFSISFWFKTTDSAQQMFAGNTSNNVTLLVYHESGNFNLRVSSTTVSWAYSSAVLANNSWHHIVFAIAKNASSQVYVDGVLLGNVTAPNADAVFTHILRGGTSSTLRGTTDEFIVFDSQIDSTKVAELYQSGTPYKFTNYTGVYAAYHLDTGSGSTYTDASGNGRNATATTAPTWTTGVVASIVEDLHDVEVWNIVNNGTHLSYGDLTFGYYNSTRGTSNIYQGLSHSFRITGTEYANLTSSAFTIGVPTTITGTTTINGQLSMAVNNSFVMPAGSGRITVGSVGSVASPSIHVAGDTNTGIRWPSADTLAFVTGGADRAYINGSGNLGLGVTNIKGRIHTAVSVAGGTHNASLIINNLNASSGGLGTGPYTGMDFSHLNDQASDIQRKMSIGFEKITTFSRGDMVISLDGSADDNNVNYIADEKLRLTMAGFLGIGTIGTTITAMLDINSDIFRLRTAKTPATSGAAGNQGDICWDADYVYVATATNTWKRATLNAF